MTTDTKRSRAKPTSVVTTRPLLVDYEAAGRMLAGVSRRTLHSLIANGELAKPRQISPGRVGFRYADLEAFVDGLPETDPPPRDNEDANRQAETA